MRFGVLTFVTDQGIGPVATIYKRYATRDELIVAALEWWMDTNRYANLPSPANGGLAVNRSTPA